jgi:hypothetical protein
MQTNFKQLTLALTAALALGFGVEAHAEKYEVTITNATGGQSFTPRLYITHRDGQLFTVGKPAISQVATIAEGGNIAPLQAYLATLGSVISDSKVGDGLLMPGKSETIMIDGMPGSKLSIIYMLLPTNDGFSGANGVTLPTSGTVVYTSPAWDSGSEPNSENCMKIPGPTCGGEGYNASEDGEGYVYIHPGIHGGADVMASKYDFRNPVTMITITKK